jgi:hypothetical protein
MSRVHWRRGDHRRNLEQAERLLADPMVDDVIIALDLIGWRLVGPSSDDRWPMLKCSALTPSWALSVNAQEKAISRGLEVVGVLDPHEVGARIAQGRGR